MTRLKQDLIRRIKAHGPISVAEYMAECLFNPAHGYYVNNDPFGAKGDFITAPDISQIFGELTASWLVQTWESQGNPTPFTLCEIGPGRGVWMQDIVTTIGKLRSDMHLSMDVAMIEKSERLAKIQSDALKDLPSKFNWINDISDLPKAHCLVIANELLDAIPTRQFVKTDQGWLERVVAIDKDDELSFTTGTGTLANDLLPLNASAAPNGTIFEYAPAREALVQQIGEQIARHGGAVLMIDYGHSKSDLGDTLQAVRNHAFEDVFANPGEADITSHVDFEALNIAAKMAGAQTHEIITQADFLLGMGLIERAGALGANADEEIRNKITTAVNRLAGNDKNQMGDLFKVMCITKKGDPTPTPFKQL